MYEACEFVTGRVCYDYVRVGESETKNKCEWSE